VTMRLKGRGGAPLRHLFTLRSVENRYKEIFVFGIPVPHHANVRCWAGSTGCSGSI
jgi:hypothetical protein